MKMVTIVPAKVRPEKCSEEEYKAIVKSGPVTVPMIKAKEALKNSKGGWQIKEETGPVAQIITPSLEQMPNDELRRLYVNAMSAAGKRLTKKRVTRLQMIQLVRSIEDSIEIVDEEEDD